MKLSKKILFVVETSNDNTFFLPASCLVEALFFAEKHLEKSDTSDEFVESVRVLYGDLLEIEPEDEDMESALDNDVTTGTIERGQA